MKDRRREIEKELSYHLGMLMAAVFWMNHLLEEYSARFGRKAEYDDAADSISVITEEIKSIRASLDNARRKEQC